MLWFELASSFLYAGISLSCYVADGDPMIQTLNLVRTTYGSEKISFRSAHAWDAKHKVKPVRTPKFGAPTIS